MMGTAFDLADRYTNPVMVLTDAVLGAMLEPVTLHPLKQTIPDKPWATVGTGKKRAKNIINSLDLSPEGLEQHNIKIQEKYRRAEREQVRYQELDVDDAEIVLIAYGTCSRVCRTAVQMARAGGIRAGLLRPISLWPFPFERIRELRERVKAFLVVELSCGQMLDDVRLGVAERVPVVFYGRMGGPVPTPGDVRGEIERVAKELR
jgi:2-oxoglutarate ferredoxin oxidoreductase subunit alpha